MPASQTPLPEASRTDAPGPVATTALSHRATRGMYWGMTSLVLSQGASVLSQLILGYKLNSEFALNGVAIAAMATIGILRDAGLRKIIIVRGNQYASLAHPLFILGLFVNLLAAALLAASAPWLANHGFQTPQPKLMPMLWITAASFIVSSFGVMQSAKLAIDMRFKAIAIQAVASGVIRQLSQAIFALMGFGELSFALPLLLTAAFDAISFRYLGGALPRDGRLTLSLIRSIFQDTKWIMVSVLGMTLAYRADGFIVAKCENLDGVVKFYIWAVMLTFQVLQPFTHVIYSTVLPVFSRMAGDVPRLAQAYLRMVGVVMFVSVPAVMAICMLIPAVIHYMPLWNGKWNPAIPVVVLFLVSTPMKSLQACALALDESRGRFDRSAGLNLADGITSLIAVTLGVVLGGMVAIGIAVAIQRTVFGLFHCFFVGSKADISIGQLARRIAPQLILGALLASLVFTWFLRQSIEHVSWQLALAVVPVLAIFALVSRMWMGELWRETRDVVLMRK